MQILLSDVSWVQWVFSGIGLPIMALLFKIISNLHYQNSNHLCSEYQCIHAMPGNSRKIMYSKFSISKGFFRLKASSNSVNYKRGGVISFNKNIVFINLTNCQNGNHSLIIFKDPSDNSFDFIEACCVSVSTHSEPYVSKILLLKIPSEKIENKILDINDIQDEKLIWMLTFHDPRIGSCLTKTNIIDYIN